MATKYISYWHDTAGAFGGAEPGPVEGRVDVAVIGAGFTGLSAARTLARAGVSVAVLEAGRVVEGGSGRNGGHLNNGIAHGYAEAKAMFGAERAHRLYKAFDRSVDMIEEIVAEEGIDCDFRRSGKLKLASKPGHVAGLRANYELIHREVDPETEWLEAGELSPEIGSDQFHGGTLMRKSAMMHMGRYGNGLAGAAVRHGARIWENAPVTARSRSGGGWELTTPRGKIRAERVILATGAYTPQNFGFFRRRIISVGSFIVATRPLSADEIARTIPGNRTYVTSLNIGNYFRLSPDNRLIYGGRARFSAVSDQRSDAKSGAILRQSMTQVFPSLADVDIDYCWGGLVDMTKDRFPRAGIAEDMIYGMGFSGHGAHLTTLIGTVLADLAMGREADNPLEDMDWPAVPLYSGKPWFLPLVGAWFALKDRLA